MTVPSFILTDTQATNGVGCYGRLELRMPNIDRLAATAEARNLIELPEYAAVRDELHDRLPAWMYEKRDPFRGYYWERRPWRSQRRLGWTGMFRPRPADGYAPVVRDYDTGLPSEGAKLEHGGPRPQVEKKGE